MAMFFSTFPNNQARTGGFLHFFSSASRIHPDLEIAWENCLTANLMYIIGSSALFGSIFYRHQKRSENTAFWWFGLPSLRTIILQPWMGWFESSTRFFFLEGSLRLPKHSMIKPPGIFLWFSKEGPKYTFNSVLRLDLGYLAYGDIPSENWDW